MALTKTLLLLAVLLLTASTISARKNPFVKAYVPFEFNTEPNITSWEVQADLLTVDAKLVPYLLSLLVEWLEKYAKKNSTDSGTFKFEGAKTKMMNGNLSVWFVEPFPNASVGNHKRYVKLMRFIESDKHGTHAVNTTRLTYKTDAVDPHTSSPLPNALPDVFQKLENDVHCTFNRASRSAEAELLPNPWFNFTYLDQMTQFLGPDLVHWTGLDPRTPLVFQIMFPFIQGEWPCEFQVEESSQGSDGKNKLHKIPCNGHFNWQGSDQPSQFSIRIKRDQVKNPNTLVPVLDALKVMFTDMTDAALGAASCLPNNTMFYRW